MYSTFMTCIQYQFNLFCGWKKKKKKKKKKKPLNLYIYIYIYIRRPIYVTMFVRFSKSLCLILGETHPELVLCQVACQGKKKEFCLSVCLSVCLSAYLYHHSGRTGRWISLKLGMVIGFDPTKKMG